MDGQRRYAALRCMARKYEHFVDCLTDRLGVYRVDMIGVDMQLVND